MPAGTAAGWAIQRSHLAVLHPYIGMHGWWVRAADIEVTDTVSTIERPMPTGDEHIPAPHRSAVPDGAYWARTTRNIDGMPQMDRVLALDVGTQGPLLLFWPEHEHYRRATAERPSLPVGWHGWWAHGQIERIGEVARGVLVDRPDLPIEAGTRVRVILDSDQPSNNGSLATVIEHRATDRYAPFRVRYDADAPHATENQRGTHGWWVNEVVAVAEAEPTFPHADRFPVGDWYSWGAQSDWFRISEVRENSVCFDQYTVSTGSIIGRNEEYTVENMDRFHDRPVHFPPGHASLPHNLRRQTMVAEEATPEFATGVRVMLTSPHVTAVDGPTHTEARRPVGFATGVLGRAAASPQTWFITWDNGGHTSVLHESCITAMPEREFANGDEVILVSDHVTTPGGRTFNEAPNGIGTRGRLDTRVNRDTGRVGIRWLNDDGTEQRHSTIHPCCLAHVPVPITEFVGPVPEPVAEHVYTVGERVEVIYGHGWDGPGTVREVDRHDITVEVDHSGRRGCFTREQIRPLDEPTVYEPMVPPMVPEGARRVRFTGRGAGRITSGNEYMAIPCVDLGYEGMWLMLTWPGHPEHTTMAQHHGRRNVPDGWRSFRSGGIVDLGAWTVEPTPEVLGYEGVPEEHWASVPEGAVKVRHSLMGGSAAREWMAIPYPDDRRMHLLIAWPGHDPQLGVGANNEGRLRQGVPRDWTSWAVTLRTDENLGPWPRVDMPTVAEDTDEVARLRAELAATQRRYDDDLARIAEIMKDEADRREWCGEYEEVSQRINRSIHGTFNGERPEDYEVLFSGVIPFDGRVVLSLPSDPSEQQVKDALVAYFAEHSLSTHGVTVDYAAVDTDDLRVDEFDVD
jgi:hypothetical protein